MEKSILTKKAIKNAITPKDKSVIPENIIYIEQNGGYHYSLYGRTPLAGFVFKETISKEIVKIRVRQVRDALNKCKDYETIERIGQILRV